MVAVFWTEHFDLVIKVALQLRHDLHASSKFCYFDQRLEGNVRLHN